MALVGAKPVADRSQVRRTNAESQNHQWHEYLNTPNVKAPPLPPRAMLSGDSDAPTGAGLGRWPDRTMSWYRAVSRMPHTRDWSQEDWEFCWDVAEQHARFHEGWKGYGGSELRLCRRMLGDTWDARRDLRIRYLDAEQWAAKLKAERKASGADLKATGTDASVTSLDAFRDL